MTHAMLARRYRTGEGYACAAPVEELGGAFELVNRGVGLPPGLLRVRVVACRACGTAYQLSARTAAGGRVVPFAIDAHTPRRPRP